MEFWFDGISTKTVLHLSRLGLLTGVTTNPNLLSEEKDVKKTLLELIEIQPGPVAVQVTESGAKDMIEEAKKLFEMNPDQIIVKIPVTNDGLEAIHALSEMDIPTMGTVIFSPNQALLAAKAGADYAALYLGRYEIEGGSFLEFLSSTAKIYKNYGLKTKIMGASLKSPNQVEECAEHGINAVTLKEPLFYEIIKEPEMTLDVLRDFDKAWKARDASLHIDKTIV